MKELISPKNYSKIKERLEELLVRSWRISRPLFPKMKLDFQVHPFESYFSTVGQIWWATPFWRGDNFSLSILLHEGHHWNIYPVDSFRALKEVYEARRLLAEEVHFEPLKKQKGLYRIEEDWSKFEYSIEEFQFVQNILGDYLVNLLIYDNYPTVWNDLWNFLAGEGTFYIKQKALPRDTTFALYLAVYPELIPNLSKIDIKEEESKEKISKIAKTVKDVRGGRISSTYAIKELVKLFHKNIVQDIKEGIEGNGEGELVCPKCNSNEGWEIVEYFDESTQQWKRLGEEDEEENAMP